MPPIRRHNLETPEVSDGCDLTNTIVSDSGTYRRRGLISQHILHFAVFDSHLDPFVHHRSLVAMLNTSLHAILRNPSEICTARGATSTYKCNSARNHFPEIAACDRLPHRLTGFAVAGQVSKTSLVLCIHPHTLSRCGATERPESREMSSFECTQPSNIPKSGGLCVTVWLSDRIFEVKSTQKISCSSPSLQSRRQIRRRGASKSW